jgi:hypothetical protein
MFTREEARERRPDRDDVLGGGRRRDLQRLRNCVRVVVLRRPVEQIGPPRGREIAAVGRRGSLVSHGDEHHVVPVVHQEEIDLVAGQRIGSVARIVENVVEIRGAERHDVQVDLVRAADDVETRTVSLALRADCLVQAVEEEARLDITAALDQLVGRADGIRGRVLHENSRSACQRVQADVRLFGRHRRV